jgi:hypothetical protein
MLRKAGAGHVASGKAYGYDNVEVLSTPPDMDGNGKRLHVLRRSMRTGCRGAADLRPVRGRDGLYADREGAEPGRVMPPRGDGRGWAPTAVREMLYRPLYRGQIVWNKSQKIDRGGTAAASPPAQSGSSWTRRSYVSCRRNVEAAHTRLGRLVGVRASQGSGRARDPRARHGLALPADRYGPVRRCGAR